MGWFNWFLWSQKRKEKHTRRNGDEDVYRLLYVFVAVVAVIYEPGLFVLLLLDPKILHGKGFSEGVRCPLGFISLVVWNV